MSPPSPLPSSNSQVTPTSVEFWPPRSGESFDWNKPTNEAYVYDKDDAFTSSFDQARRKLDYSYHLNPRLDRQQFQDSVLSRVITGSSLKNHERPWIVFTAGPMGVGKSYVLSQLFQKKLFPLDEFVKIDPDMLKSELPEMPGYLQQNPETAATKLHRESTQMSDVLFEHSLLSRYHILVDGSLRDVEWFQKLFGRLRTEHPEYRLAILYVSATEETIRNRAAARASKTGRAVPEDILAESIEQVPRSVEALAPLTDVTFEISNDDGKPMILKSCSGELRSSWETFRETWRNPLQCDDHEDQKYCEEFDIINCKLTHCFESSKEHEAAQLIWGKMYPSFCARCQLACDMQCGVCIHNHHACACTICNLHVSLCQGMAKPDLPTATKGL